MAILRAILVSIDITGYFTLIGDILKRKLADNN